MLRHKFYCCLCIPSVLLLAKVVPVPLCGSGKVATRRLLCWFCFVFYIYFLARRRGDPSKIFLPFMYARQFKNNEVTGILNKLWQE